ncbi:outer membrane lipoprotein-sorting protein [Aquimarina sp. D1M17]|uniref:outer membrane lipoprotein-sorting protein n=1 Tax=Aquimarina acroporae TaxID=2937283 RepID=UPI0020C14693|nr:outer membrane lipoprotein-sorting protein [Aquimarina acroporae]MCK8522361.1 outer membrane lipoprotein-sorting protein [Aquimarina acroporae]
MKTIIFRTVALVVMIITISSKPILETDYDTILKRADQYRGGQVPGISWEVQVQNIEEGAIRNELNLKVEASTTDTQQFALITFLKPKKYGGQKLLLRGNNMWFIKKGLSRPVPISGRQRLSGSASNADVASANYYQDYDISEVKETEIDGQEYWLYELVAKNNLVSYSKIKYWINKEDYHGVKAEFYGKSKKLIKTAFFKYQNEMLYENEKDKYISEVKIVDNINTEDSTILNMTSPEFKSFSNSKFQKSVLMD